MSESGKRVQKRGAGSSSFACQSRSNQQYFGELRLQFLQLLPPKYSRGNWSRDAFQEAQVHDFALQPSWISRLQISGALAQDCNHRCCKMTGSGFPKQSGGRTKKAFEHSNTLKSSEDQSSPSFRTKPTAGESPC